jgi:hypothetical protein
MDIPVSLVGKGPISLPLQCEAPIHLSITIPFSLLVKDFDPNTTQVPQCEKPRSWLATRLFGRQYETPTDATSKTLLLVSPALRNRVWSKLSTLLFGKEEPIMYLHSASDVREWKHAGAANVFWAFATGITEDHIGDVRALVLTASPGGPDDDGTGGVLFTVDEMGDAEKAAWKTAWTVLPPIRPSPDDEGEFEADLAMENKNRALCRLKAGWVDLQVSSEKESFESV